MYGWEKLQAEHLYRCYRQAYGIETHIARFDNVYGPNGTWCGGREKAPAAFCRKIVVAKLTGNPDVEIWGDGGATRPFLWVGDCVDAITQLIETGYGEPISLGPNWAVSVNELVDIIAGIAGVEIRKVYVNQGYQGVRGRAFDHTRCQDVLGWVPDTPLEVGLESTYAWVEEQVRAALERGETL
jgi:nucleoside-diphosphate-sugar epimerase